MTTNESWWLVGGFPLFSTLDPAQKRPPTSLNDSLVAFCLPLGSILTETTPTLPLCPQQDHQQVSTTRWWLSISLRLSTLTLMTTNESSRLVGGWTANNEWYNPGHVVWCVLGNWYVSIITTFYFSLLNIIFKYYMTMTTKVSDVGGCGQRTMSGTTQDTSFDVYWAIGMFLLSLLFIFHY